MLKAWQRALCSACSEVAGQGDSSAGILLPDMLTHDMQVFVSGAEEGCVVSHLQSEVSQPWCRLATWAWVEMEL